MTPRAREDDNGMPVDADGEDISVGLPGKPAIERTVKAILQEDPDHGLSIDVAKYVAVQNLKRWFDFY